MSIKRRELKEKEFVESTMNKTLMYALIGAMEESIIGRKCKGLHD